MNKTELINALNEAKRLHTIALDDNTPEDESDAAYAKWWETCREIAAGIRALVGGRIDDQTAMRMVIHKRNEIFALVERWAA